MTADDDQPAKIPSSFRIGSVPYLNSVPLTCGIENQVVFAPPSQLATMLENETLDAALVSVTEALLHPGYAILDNVAVACDGPVISVFLATRIPLNSIEVVHCDPASLTSINLLKILLKAKGVQPQWHPLSSYEESFEKDAVLLIGDPAIAFIQADHKHRIWDLGAAWKELTGLPFVFAVWAIRQGYEDPALLSSLMSAKLRGIAQLPALIEGESRFDPDFRKEYLGKAIQYDLGEREKTAIHCFMEKLASGGLGQEVYPPRFVYHEIPKK